MWKLQEIKISVFVIKFFWNTVCSFVYCYLWLLWGFPKWLSGKEPACQCRRWRSFSLIPEFGRFPWGGHGNPLQYSCQGNPMDRGAWRAPVRGVTESDTTEHPCGRFYTIVSVLNGLGQRPYDPQSLKYLLFDFLQKNLLIPDLDYLQFFFILKVP